MARAMGKRFCLSEEDGKMKDQDLVSVGPYFNKAGGVL
jgi:hypothetical protein